ncbi:trypsin-like peptidase domain-containing protein [Candidatus Woesearchaeota archaeon]|nr:trypsin-like peptidase domain-containing protein [Candidatus Woesearchaeota archaeon]
MKKENKIILAFGIILIVLVSTVVIFEYNQSKTFQERISQESSRVNTALEELKKQNTLIAKDVSSLKEKTNILTKNIAEKETQIQTLSGELTQLREENIQQLGELEEKINTLKTQNEDFSTVIEKSIPSVVSIRTDVGSGSGFLISSDGLVVTNNHVIAGATAAAIVTSDGTSHTVFLVGRDTSSDLALLRIEGDNFAYLDLGNSDNLQAGEKVIAIGNPGGLDFTVTQGIVSAFRREDGNNYIQIDVAINPGNSGGPLLNAAGDVIGVTTKKISGFEGVGFALASNQVDEVVDYLLVKQNQ